MSITYCPYCDKQATVVFGSEIYIARPELNMAVFWRCEDCDAHVRIGSRATMANRYLRSLRIKAHEALDPLWSTKLMTRNEVYTWLSEALDKPSEACHIGLFDINTCVKVIDLSEEKLDVLNNPRN